MCFKKIRVFEISQFEDDHFFEILAIEIAGSTTLQQRQTQRMQQQQEPSFDKFFFT